MSNDSKKMVSVLNANVRARKYGGQRVCLCYVPLVLCFCGCGHWSEGTGQASNSRAETRTITGQKRVIISSDFEMKPDGVFMFDDFIIGNEKADSAKVKLISRSCSCVKIGHVPPTLEGHDEFEIAMSVQLSPGSPRQSLGSVVELAWPDESRRLVTARQDVEIRPELRVEPVALTFLLEANRDARQRQLQISKDIVTRFHYRSDTQRKIPPPFVIRLPRYVTVEIVGDAVHQKLADKVWQATWRGRLTIENPTSIGDSDIGNVFWTEFRVHRIGTGFAALQVPLSLAYRRVGVSAHPDYLVFDSLEANQIVLKSWDGRPFRIIGERSLSGLPFDVSPQSVGEKLIHQVNVVPLVDQITPGVFNLKVQTTHPESAMVTVPLIVSNSHQEVPPDPGPAELPAARSHR